MPMSVDAAAGSEPILDASDEYEKALYKLLFNVPVPLLPLYAQVVVLGRSLIGGPAGTCVTTCGQLVRAQQLWGFRAEAVAAYANVYRFDGRSLEPLTVVGKATDAPSVDEADGRTNGHMIVYARDFKRYIDMTISQAASLLEAGKTTPAALLPAMVPVESAEQINDVPPQARYGGFAVVHRTTPQWTAMLEDMLAGDLADAVDYGALSLAHQALDTLRQVGEVRNLRPLHSLYPTLRDLLSGRKSLPPLPASPPANVSKFLHVTAPASAS